MGVPRSKKDLQTALREAGIEFEESLGFKELRELYVENQAAIEGGEEGAGEEAGEGPASEGDAPAEETPASNESPTSESGSDDIEVGSPVDLRPKNLPLVVKLPRGASSAQREYAKVLNAYAYTNPKKWEKKKDKLIARLRSLADHEVPEQGDKKLSINKSSLSFVFIPDGKGGEIFAGAKKEDE